MKNPSVNKLFKSVHFYWTVATALIAGVYGLYNWIGEQAINKNNEKETKDKLIIAVQTLAKTSISKTYFIKTLDSALTKNNEETQQLLDDKISKLETSLGKYMYSSFNTFTAEFKLKGNRSPEEENKHIELLKQNNNLKLKLLRYQLNKELKKEAPKKIETLPLSTLMNNTSGLHYDFDNDFLMEAYLEDSTTYYINKPKTKSKSKFSKVFFWKNK